MTPARALLLLGLAALVAGAWLTVAEHWLLGGLFFGLGFGTLMLWVAADAAGMWGPRR